MLPNQNPQNFGQINPMAPDMNMNQFGNMNFEDGVGFMNFQNNMMGNNSVLMDNFLKNSNNPHFANMLPNKDVFGFNFVNIFSLSINNFFQ